MENKTKLTYVLTLYHNSTIFTAETEVYTDKETVADDVRDSFGVSNVDKVMELNHTAMTFKDVTQTIIDMATPSPTQWELQASRGEDKRDEALCDEALCEEL